MAIPVQPLAKRHRYQDKAQSVGVVAVKEAIKRLKCDSISCTQEFWLSMPTMGYAIASAFERPVILLVEETWLCWSFLPYRIPFKRCKPIVLSFVDQNHFVGYDVGSGSIPCPPLFHQGWSTCGNKHVTSWKAEFDQSWKLWQDTVLPSLKVQKTKSRPHIVIV